MNIDTYLNKIREKNKKNKTNYDSLITEIPYITNIKDLEKLKEILEELKNENKDFYNHLISLLKNNTDLDSLFLLYKEYKNAKRREDVLNKELSDKSLEFKEINDDLDRKEDLLKDFDNDSKKLKDSGKIIADLSTTISINLDRAFDKIEQDDITKLGFGTKVLLAIGSFLAFKNNKNILGVLLASYLSYKIIEELVANRKSNYLELCDEYLNSLEKYQEEALEVEKNLVNNLENLEAIEASLKDKYKEYLKEKEFKRILKMIEEIKNTVNDSMKEIDKTKDNINRNIDDGKSKVKVLEG